MEDVFEKIVQDLLEKQYSIVDNFFEEKEVENLRDILLLKYEEDEFKKAAIGNVFNEQIVKSIRGDFISWIDEKEAVEAEKVFFDRISDFTSYLNRTCFLGIREREFHYALYPKGADFIKDIWILFRMMIVDVCLLCVI